jgi:hypothetical protein
VRSKIKKIEKAMINTLQLAARKNLIQMSFRTFKALINNLPWLFYFSIPEKQRVQKQTWHISRINASNYWWLQCNWCPQSRLCEGHLKTWSEESNIMFGSWRQTFRSFTLGRKYDWSSSWFFYNRQVTHNAPLYENQDFNVLKITNLTFKTDIL